MALFSAHSERTVHCCPVLSAAANFYPVHGNCLGPERKGLPLFGLVFLSLPISWCKYYYMVNAHVSSSYFIGPFFCLLFLHLIHQILDHVLSVTKEHHFLSLMRLAFIDLRGPCGVGMLAKMMRDSCNQKHVWWQNSGSLKKQQNKSCCKERRLIHLPAAQARIITQKLY